MSAAHRDAYPPLFAEHSIPVLLVKRRVWARRERSRLAKIRTLKGEGASKATIAEWETKRRKATKTKQAFGAAIVWKRMPLRLRALKVARAHLGIREEGGNNQGADVMAIIRENGGTGPEAWCGDFVAHCYRIAGSASVTRLWAGVRWLGRVVGTRALRSVRRALAGDIVCFRWPTGGDHTGILVGYCDVDGNPVRPADATHVHTIDGNASAQNVSDSVAGGDGVVEAIRSIGLVERMVRVRR